MISSLSRLRLTNPTASLKLGSASYRVLLARGSLCNFLNPRSFDCNTNAKWSTIKYCYETVMVVKIRLARFGRRHAPFYNIVVAQARYYPPSPYIQPSKQTNTIAQDGKEQQANGSDRFAQPIPLIHCIGCRAQCSRGIESSQIDRNLRPRTQNPTRRRERWPQIQRYTT